MPRKKEVNSLDRFYSDILRNHITNKIHFDTKANWLLGVSAVIMGLSLPQMRYGFVYANSGYVIIFLSALASFLLSLVIFEPPNFLLPIPHSNQSLMYYKSFKQMPPEEYARKLKQIKTSDQVVEQYAYDITNLVNRNIMIKSKYIKWPAFILFFGVSVGSLLILFV